MQDQGYTQPSRPDQARHLGFVLADRRMIQATLDALRASPRRICWWCARPLTGGVCPICDAEPAL